jgi:hypothetical protein
MNFHGRTSVGRVEAHAHGIYCSLRRVYRAQVLLCPGIELVKLCREVCVSTLPTIFFWRHEEMDGLLDFSSSDAEIDPG